MLEVVNAAGVLRQGEARMEFSSAKQGYITYIKGIDSDGNVVVSCPNDSAQAFLSYYPVKKLRFEEDLSDTSAAVDDIARNSQVIFYEGGEFITDHFSRQSFSFGKALRTSTASQRGGYGVDVVQSSVSPTTLLYTVYWGDQKGILTATAVGTSEATSPYKADTNPAKFRMIQVWGASAVSSMVPAISLRFKVIPGHLNFN